MAEPTRYIILPIRALCAPSDVLHVAEQRRTCVTSRHQHHVRPDALKQVADQRLPVDLLHNLAGEALTAHARLHDDHLWNVLCRLITRKPRFW